MMGYLKKKSKKKKALEYAVYSVWVSDGLVQKEKCSFCVNS